MKKTSFLMLFLLVLSPFTLTAQHQYGPNLVEGRSWVYDYHHFEVIDELTGQYDEKVMKLSYTLKGDTIINGTSYHKIYWQWDDGEPAYRMAYREEGSTVFCYDNRTGGDRVVMELETDRFMETALPFIYNFLHVTDTIAVNGRLFCRHKYKENEMDQYPFIAVEGIGFCDTGLIDALANYVRPTCVCDYTMFRECYENGELIFRNSDFKIESTNGLDRTTVSPVRQRGTLFDLQGRRLKEAPEHGVVIEDGRKKVLR